MSKAPELPSNDDAVATLDAVYCQRFFDKMASYGYHPQTDEDKMAMLQTALQLDAVPDEPQPAAASPYVAAQEKLAAALNQHGYGQPQASDRDQLVQALASDETFFKSALAVVAADAEGSDN